MQLAIVYDSRTGTTKAMAEQMAEMTGSAGHSCALSPVQAADPSDVAAADVVCIGSWTEGLFFIFQHATKATMEFIGQLSLDGQPAAVFCTYKTSPGKMLGKMAAALATRGAHVTGEFKSRGPSVPGDFAGWLDSLDTV